MNIPTDILTDFRQQLRKALEGDPGGWADSRLLLAPSLRKDTLQRLRTAAADSALDPNLRDELLRVLVIDEEGELKAVPGEALRRLTGLNPTKALRNLCLLLKIGKTEQEETISSLTQSQVEAAVRGRDNPFDALLAGDVPSVVDFGAGDLTFDEELVARYIGDIAGAGRKLTLHAFDRIDPQEGFGELVRAGTERLNRLRHYPSPALRFRYEGNLNMLDLTAPQGGLPRYTIAVCNSPSTPTFAYEPSRLSPQFIQDRLRKTKGEFRRVKAKGREVLEVLHGTERLTFPAWKFDIYGPLALLDLLSRKGQLCVLGAVDIEVFWEILSQLLPDETARPRDVFFSADNVQKFFGSTYDELLQLAIGERLVLDRTRQAIPRVLELSKGQDARHAFRYVEIRRGAVFPGIPAGRTARVFGQMTQEAPPWFLTLVPAA